MLSGNQILRRRKESIEPHNGIFRYQRTWIMVTLSKYLFAGTSNVEVVLAPMPSIDTSEVILEEEDRPEVSPEQKQKARDGWKKVKRLSATLGMFKSNIKRNSRRTVRGAEQVCTNTQIPVPIAPYLRFRFLQFIHLLLICCLQNCVFSLSVRLCRNQHYRYGF